MNRKWIHGFIASLAIVALAGCSQSVEDQVSVGLENAQTTFEETPAEPNKTIGHIEVYIPNGFSIELGIDESNYTLTKGEDSYILFVNPYETVDSQLHYDILMNDEASEFLREKTFETEGVFGFSAAVKKSEKQFELIVSIGGAKLTTISNDKNIDEKLQEMMEIVQSIHLIDK